MGPGSPCYAHERKGTASIHPCGSLRRVDDAHEGVVEVIDLEADARLILDGNLVRLCQVHTVNGGLAEGLHGDVRTKNGLRVAEVANNGNRRGRRTRAADSGIRGKRVVSAGVGLGDVRRKANRKTHHAGYIARAGQSRQSRAACRRRL